MVEVTDITHIVGTIMGDLDMDQAIGYTTDMVVDTTDTGSFFN